MGILRHLPVFPLHPERALGTLFAPLPVAAPFGLESPFRVWISDMDSNRHVNNAVYVAWALATTPVASLRDWRPAEAALHFRGAAVFGDRILSRRRPLSDPTAPAFLHQLVRDRDGREFTRLLSRWQPAGEE